MPNNLNIGRRIETFKKAHERHMCLLAIISRPSFMGAPSSDVVLVRPCDSSSQPFP